MKTSQFAVSGLFAGVGGIELGFQKAGFSPVFANEIDEKASVTYQLNHKHKLLTQDINQLSSKDIPRTDVLTGGFPCQAFSLAGYRKGFKDPRGNLFWEIIRLIEDKKPKVVFLENVKNLTSHDGGKTFHTIITALKKQGYFLKFDVLNADSYGGIPQNRERIYIVGFKSKSIANYFTFPNELKNVRDLGEFIDFDSKVDDSFYYKDKYMYPKLKIAMTNKSSVYQWRRQYVRENKSNRCPTLTANMGTGGHNVPLINTKYGIRKLTPKECFNLMGFPKSFKLPSEMANSHLYKQAGNAVVVPVIERIARNILASLEGKPLPSPRDEELSLF